MDVTLPIGSIVAALSDYAWPFLRVAAFVMTMPIIGGAFVPARVRLLLAIGLTAIIAPVLPAMTGYSFVSIAGAIAVLQELAIGIAMGFAVQLLFDAISLGGQVIAMSMGLGFAVFVDRQRGVNIPVLGQFFLMLSMLVFLSMDGHLALIRLLADSFSILPIGGSGLTRVAVASLLAWSSQVFVVALQIALPAITALIIVNLAFGVMSRAAPTLNLFAVGFPVSMLLGFIVVFLSIGGLTENVEHLADAAITFLPDMLRAQ